MSIDWNLIRKEYFPALKLHTYIMAASASPLNKMAYDQGINYFNTMLNHGDMYYERFKEDVDKNRESIAEYINCKPNEIVFVPNVSAGMNIIARMLDKVEIIYPSVEFPASVHIFKRLGYPSKKVLPTNNKYTIQNIERATSSNTKISIHSHVQSLTGFRQNLNKLGIFCKQHSLINIINATQSFGSFDIDVKKEKIDILISNSLKWLGCGYGAAVLFINQEFFNEREIPFSGWLSVENPFTMDNDDVKIINHPRYMDTLGGCPNYGALLALKGSFDLIKEQIGGGNIKNGIKKIQERIIWLTNKFLEKLMEYNLNIITPLELEFRSGIITIEHPKAEKLYELFIKNNILTTLKQYPSATENTLLRFSFNYYNNETDIDRVIDILKVFNP